ncbi:MAG: hypothetical protein QM780_15835 [Hyphomicrobium sp.]|uniref:hypothetical protein n=1 Tax=Hyphomicrobium sp. TaxID=82 RepID=UPI0039E3A8EA
MSGLKFVVGALAAGLSLAAFSSAADATFYRGCGYDPYGYHAPDYRGCPTYIRRAYRKGWGFYPAYGFYPAGSYYALPRYYPVYPVPAPVYPAYPVRYCYYDNGYDFRVRSVCVPAW